MKVSVLNPNAVTEIPDRQNEEHFLRLLRARSQIYAEATRFQITQLLLVVLLPVVGSVVGLILPDSRPYIAFISLVIVVLDTAWLDRSQRRKIKAAAKLSEQYDCELLSMPWNKLVAGSYLDPEQIEAAALAWSKGDGKLRNWYPCELRGVPLPLARAMCQRTNAWYDGSLRDRYASLLLWLVGGAFGVFLLIALILKLPLTDLTATVLSPAAPALIWCLREQFRQRDIVELAKGTQSEAENLCDKAAKDGADQDECAATARALQNAIYARRASSPLMFPFIYSLNRNRMEKLMKAGAAEILRRLGVEK